MHTEQTLSKDADHVLGEGIVNKSVAKTDVIDNEANMLIQSAIDTWSWVASAGEIGHSRGMVYNENAEYWYDPGTSNAGHTCYGPYITLEPGLYESWWFLETQEVPCSGNLGWKAAVGEDIVSNFGNHVIREERFLFFVDICQNHDGKFNGGIGGEFRIHATTPYVEFRVKTGVWEQWVLYKRLVVKRIGD